MIVSFRTEIMSTSPLSTPELLRVSAPSIWDRRCWSSCERPPARRTPAGTGGGRGYSQDPRPRPPLQQHTKNETAHCRRSLQRNKPLYGITSLFLSALHLAFSSHNFDLTIRLPGGRQWWMPDRKRKTPFLAGKTWQKRDGRNWIKPPILESESSRGVQARSCMVPRDRVPKGCSQKDCGCSSSYLHQKYGSQLTFLLRATEQGSRNIFCLLSTDTLTFFFETA